MKNNKLKNKKIIIHSRPKTTPFMARMDYGRSVFRSKEPRVSVRVGSIILLTVLYLAILSVNFVSQAADKDLEQLKGEHFLVYYGEDEEFARDVLRRAEFYYKKIANELGYDRHSAFWTWEKRVKIFIFPTRQAFFDATGTNTWSEGLADYTEKKIISYVWSKGFLDSLLPHEIAHLIFRDFVGFKGEVHLWLDEGVAQWMEPEKRADVIWIMAQIMQENKAIPLKELIEIDIKEVDDSEKVYVFYIEAASLVGYLMQEFGSKSFVEFCKQLRSGKSLKLALTFAYPTKIRSIAQLEEKWAEYIIKEGGL